MTCESFDVCLLDYQLGERTGLDLLREMIARGCRTPIILLTGNDDRDIDVEAMEAGAADYLVKGQFDGRLLERSIRYAIGYAVERQRTLDALRLQRGTVRPGGPGGQRRPLGLGPDDQQDLLQPALEVDARATPTRPIGDSSRGMVQPGSSPDIDRVRAEVEEHFQGRTYQLQTEHRMVHDDGTYRWVLTRGLAVRDDAGASRPGGGLPDRHHPAQGGRGPAAPRRVPRRLDRPAQPRLFIDRLEQAIVRKKRPGHPSLRRPLPRS